MPIRKLWQYQVTAKPTTPPGQEAERVSYDKWAQNTDIPRSNWRHRAKVAAFAAAIPAFFFTDQAIAAPETVTLDKWEPRLEKPLFGPKHFERLYPTEFRTEYTSIFPGGTEVTIPGSQSIIVSFPTTLQYQGLAYTERAMVVAEEITVDKWHPQPNEPYLRVKHREFQYPASFLELDNGQRPETVSFDRWHFQQSEPQRDIQRWQFTYPSSFYDTQALTQGETITPDKWLGYHPDRYLDVARQQWQYPSFFAAIEEEPTEEVSVESWFRTTEKPRWDMKRWQFLYPSLQEIDHFLLTQPEAISLDRWIGTRPDQVFDRARLQWLYPPLTLEPSPTAPPPEAITIDKWFPGIVLRPMTVRHNQYGFPYLSFHSEPITAVAPAVLPRRLLLGVGL